jgi:hypothetical protein
MVVVKLDFRALAVRPILAAITDKCPKTSKG